ncbi:hypothetical protein ABT336_26055 [Micromonospora sp. NPDC000207]|uniref:hypothetical protein n=1 Tax=Micromonospora sp. NPDC000207 TaxID=3154246 RepID=UPI0033227235
MNWPPPDTSVNLGQELADYRSKGSLPQGCPNDVRHLVERFGALRGEVKEFAADQWDGRDTMRWDALLAAANMNYQAEMGPGTLTSAAAASAPGQPAGTVTTRNSAHRRRPAR